MTWVKIDDQFTDHPKIVEAGPLAAWLYVCSLTYASRYLTDGFIPDPQVRRLADLKNVATLVQKLVDTGLWDRVANGYNVHDYLDYNPTAERVKAEREAAKERMKNKRSSPELLPNIAGSSPSPTRTPSHTPVVGTEDSESTTTKSIPKQTSARRSVQSAEAIDNFNVFAEALWENYPRDKDGTRPGRKAKFLAALKKVDVSEWDDLEAGLEKYKLWAKVKKGYVLNAETWVTERVWVESLEAQPIKQLNGTKPSFDDPEIVAKYTEGPYAPMFGQGAKT